MQRLSDAAREAVAAYAASVAPPARRLASSWDSIVDRLGEDVEIDGGVPDGRSTASRWALAAFVLAAAALVVAALAHWSIAGLRTEVDPPPLAPYEHEASRAEIPGEPEPTSAARPRAILVPIALPASIEPQRPIVTPAPVPAPTGRAPAPTRAVDPTRDQGLAREVELLARARAAVRDGEAARALRLLDALRRAHPRGALLEERTALRVKALCEAGRAAEADRERARFLREHPGSPLAATLPGPCVAQRSR